jgi:hypothetical protein
VGGLLFLPPSGAARAFRAPVPSAGDPMPAGGRADPRSAEGTDGAPALGPRSVAARPQGQRTCHPAAAAETPPPAPARQPASALPAPFSAPAPRGCSALPLPSCLSSLLFLNPPNPPASAASGRDWDFLRSQGWGRGPLAAVGPGL